jgi:Domain of unknown function (DUF4184)
MPATFPAHQALVLPLALRFSQTDAVALCLGSAAPDLAYAFLNTRLHFDGHFTWAALGWGIPVALVLSLVVRWVAQRAQYWAPAKLAAVLGQIRPADFSRRALAMLVACAAFGIFTHSLWDAFTHGRSPLVRFHLRGLLAYAVHWPMPIRWVTVLQWLGHSVGSALALWLYWKMWRQQPQPPNELAMAGLAPTQRPGWMRGWHPPWRLALALSGGLLAMLASAYLRPLDGSAAPVRGFWLALAILTVSLIGVDKQIVTVGNRDN